MKILALILSAAVLSVAACWLVRLLPLRDVPDGERKLQDGPVPTAGGLGILAATAIPVLVLALQPDAIPAGSVTAADLMAILVLVLAPWLIGLADDWLGLPALVKLGLLCAWAVAAAWPQFAAGNHLIGLGVFVWLLVITNAANFMDGSNGLALGSLGIMILALFPLYVMLLFCWGSCSRTPVGDLAVVSQIAMAGAIGGFLVWNLRGALYAGDTGALGAGGLFGLMTVYHLDSTLDGLRAAVFALTVSLPFLLDVLLTLAWRSLKGKNILKAHTDHAYQRFRATGWGHLTTAFTWWGLTVVCAVTAIVTLFAGIDSEGDTFPVSQLVALVVLAAIGTGLWLRERRRAVSTPG